MTFQKKLVFFWDVRGADHVTLLGKSYIDTFYLVPGDVTWPTVCGTLELNVRSKHGAVFIHCPSLEEKTMLGKKTYSSPSCDTVTMQVLVTEAKLSYSDHHSKHTNKIFRTK